MQDSILATIIVNKSVLDNTKELICDTTKVQTIIDSACIAIINSTTPLGVWQAAQQFHDSIVNGSLIIITILVALIAIALTYLSYKSEKNLEKETEIKIKKEMENLKSIVIDELKPEIRKFKAISYFTDSRDMQIYRIVKIGSQTWMAENFNYAATGSICYNNNPDNSKKYGRLYDLDTAKKNCPVGWHLPSNDEWQILINFVDGDNIAGKKLKAESAWNENGNSEDEYFFAALPGGLWHITKGFIRLGYKGVWWSATEINPSEAYSRGIDCGGDYVFTANDNKSNLLSVRYVRDL